MTHFSKLHGPYLTVANLYKFISRLLQLKKDLPGTMAIIEAAMRPAPASYDR